MHATAPGSFHAVRPQANASYGTHVAATLVSEPVHVNGDARFYAAGLNLPDAPVSLPAGALRCLVAEGDQVCAAGFPKREKLAVVDYDTRSGRCDAAVTQTQLRLEVHSTTDCSAATLPIPVEAGHCTAFPTTNVRSVDLLLHTTTTVNPTSAEADGLLKESYFTACCISE